MLGEVFTGGLKPGDLLANVPIAREAAMLLVAGLLLLAPPLGSARTVDAAPCKADIDARSVCTTAIFGRVIWADGDPAGNGRIRLVADSSESSDDTDVIELHTDPTGRYEATICPCARLVAFLMLDDGVSCQVPLVASTVAASHAEVASPAGMPVDAADQVSWIANRGTCEPTPL
jgi:hypothetical protein